LTEREGTININKNARMKRTVPLSGLVCPNLSETAPHPLETANSIERRRPR
jgi:hypothetical protein